MISVRVTLNCTAIHMMTEAERYWLWCVIYGAIREASKEASDG